MSANKPTSRARFDEFVDKYKRGQLATHPSEDEEPRSDPPDESKEGSNKEPDEKPASRWGGPYLRQYVGWLRPHAASLAAVLVLALVAAGIDMAQPLLIRQIIDGVLLSEQGSLAERLQGLHRLGATILGLIVVGQLLTAFRSYRMRQLNVRVVLSLRRSLHERLLRLPLETLSDMKTGGIISRLTDDVNTTTGLLQLALISPTVSAVRVLLALSIVIAMNWRLALTAMAVIPGVMLLSFLAIRRIRPIYRTIRRDVSSVDGRVGEAFGGIRAVRSFRGERREEQDYAIGHHTIVRKRLFAHRRELVIWSTWSFLTTLIGLVIIWFGGYLQIFGRASVGELMAFQVYTFMLLNPIWQIVESISEMQRSLAAMERVFDVLEMPEDKPDRPAAVEAPPTVERIQLENVTFAYGDREPVIRDFSLDVPGGSVVALVGRSGAGKTTLTDLVARFYDPTAGRILLNGTDMRDIQLKTFRELLGIVQQEVFLFDGSVRDNIAYGRPSATIEEVADAARRANAEQFVRELPEGYDTLIGERGVKLSGGQRQRLSIARAILADPQILILDEATSNLDTESEQLIQQSLESLLRGRTTFMIAHRLSTIAHADVIVVVERGEVAEKGKHQELMARRGLYYEMVTRQQDAISLP